MSFFKDDNFFCKCGCKVMPDRVLQLNFGQIFTGYCHFCNRLNAIKIIDGQTIHKTSAEANRMLRREKKNILSLQMPLRDNIYGLCYGVNKEIKNKKGKVIQIRQYGYDLASGRSRGRVKTIKIDR